MCYFDYMKKLSTRERDTLSHAAHSLKPLVQIGQNGVSENVTAQIDEMLRVHELIKIKFNEFKDEKRTLSETLAEQTHSVIVRIIGNIAIFYRPAKDADKRKYGILL